MSTEVLPFTELIPERAYELMSPEEVMKMHEHLLATEIQDLYTESREHYHFRFHQILVFVTSTMAFLTAGLFIPIAILALIWWFIEAKRTYRELAERATIQVWRRTVYTIEHGAKES